MSQPYVGEIRMFGGNFAPASWAFCNGQLLPISQNETLFQLIGTTYGGDGQNTFALPDMQGRIPIHQGTGPGLSTYVIGQAAGVENVTLTANQIPSHTHDLLAGAGGTKQASPSNAYWASGGPQQFASGRVTPITGALQGGLGQTSGGQSHTNVMPFLAVSFIISFFGIFPSPN
jgi:microcystin-dependent protein